MSKCRYCPAILKWKQPYTKGDFPTELNGKKHNCPNRRESTRENMFNFDMFAESPPPRKKYYFCGKCKTLCTENNFDWWCPTCEMFPTITHDGNDELFAEFEADTDVKPLMITNRDEVCEKYRIITGGEAPVNWIHMKKDGTTKTGYKLTEELTKWFNGEGSNVITKINSEIWYKKKELK